MWRNKKLTRLTILPAMLLAAMTSLAAPNEEQGKLLLHKGDSLYRQGNFEEAAIAYLISANEGNAEAQFDIAYAYFNGEGIERDYASAAMWFKRSARQNYAKAQYNLAYCYMNGRGVPRDYDKAFDLLHQSANNNYKRAQLTLADCYANGILVEQNEKESQKWMAMAANLQPEQPKTEPAAPNTPSTPSTPSAPSTPNTPSSPSTPNIPTPEPIVQASANKATEKPDTKKETLDGDFDIEVDIPGMNSTPQPTAPVVVAQPAAPQPTTEQPAAPKPTEEQPKPRIIKGPAHILAEKEATPAAQPTLAAANSAPVLKILYPEDQSMFHTDQIKLKYQLIAGNCADSTRIVVMVDGQRQPTTRAVRAANTIDVDLPRHDCTVMMYAQNKNGNSEPATIRLIREATSMELPKLFVVAIGVGDYNDPKLPKLRFTCKDAKDFSKAITSKKGLPYEDVQVKILCDNEATRADIFEAMEWLKQESSPNDVCIFFFAGHGMRDEKDRFYFMPYGCNTNKLYECFSASDFRNEAEDIHGKLIAFVDACYSGALFEGGRSAATTHFIEQLKRSKNGMLLYASSSSDTKSREDESWENGAFTKALVEALNGAAKEEHAEGLSTQELEHFLYKQVRKLTDFKQTPIFINPSGIEHFNIFNYEK
uniref:caspase family protein n=1 Tax=Prevotella sp. TaxID=59823 RepID=UPI00402A1FF3